MYQTNRSWDICQKLYETYCFGQVHEFGCIQIASGTLMFRNNFILNIMLEEADACSFLIERKLSYERTSCSVCMCAQCPHARLVSVSVLPFQLLNQ
jgi:hypothetical protein